MVGRESFVLIAALLCQYWNKSVEVEAFAFSHVVIRPILS